MSDPDQEHIVGSNPQSTDIPIGIINPELGVLDEQSTFRLLFADDALEFGSLFSPFRKLHKHHNPDEYIECQKRFLPEFEGGLIELLAESDRFDNVVKLLSDLEQAFPESSPVPAEMELFENGGKDWQDLTDEARRAIERANAALGRMKVEDLGLLSHFAYYLFRLGSYHTLKRLLPRRKYIEEGMKKSYEITLRNVKRGRKNAADAAEVIATIKDLLVKFPDRSSHPFTLTPSNPNQEKVICWMAAKKCGLRKKKKRQKNKKGKAVYVYEYAWKSAYNTWNSAKKAAIIAKTRELVEEGRQDLDEICAQVAAQCEEWGGASPKYVRNAWDRHTK